MAHSKQIAEKINPILHRPKLYRALMALRLEVDQSIVDHLAEIIGEEINQAKIEAYKDGYINGGEAQANNKFFVKDKI